MSISIHDVIEDFDTKHTAPLQEFASRHSDSNTIKEAVSLLSGDRKQQHAASWILLSWVQHGVELSPQHIDQIIVAAPGFEYWEVQLHFVQMIPHITLSNEQANAVYAQIEGYVESEAKFVRTWALNAAVHLAGQLPEKKDHAYLLLAKALDDEAASVRARARRLEKQLEKL